MASCPTCLEPPSLLSFLPFSSCKLFPSLCFLVFALAFLYSYSYLYFYLYWGLVQQIRDRTMTAYLIQMIQCLLFSLFSALSFLSLTPMLHCYWSFSLPCSISFIIENLLSLLSPTTNRKAPADTESFVE